MQLSKPAPSPIDAQILQIASLTDLPSRPVNLRPVTAIHGAQIQQIRVMAATPVVNSASPITTQRLSLGGGAFQYRLSFIAPQDRNYQGVTLLLNGANGASKLLGAGGQGPIIFTSNKTTAPSSVVVQQNNNNGSSTVGLGAPGAKVLLQF